MGSRESLTAYQSSPARNFLHSIRLNLRLSSCLESERSPVINDADRRPRTLLGVTTDANNILSQKNKVALLCLAKTKLNNAGRFWPRMRSVIKQHSAPTDAIDSID